MLEQPFFWVGSEQQPQQSPGTQWLRLGKNVAKVQTSYIEIKPMKINSITLGGKKDLNSSLIASWSRSQTATILGGLARCLFAHSQL